jgi:hypothetical protein
MTPAQMNGMRAEQPPPLALKHVFTLVLQHFDTDKLRTGQDQRRATRESQCCPELDCKSLS